MDDGSIIKRGMTDGLRRLIDQRDEQRSDTEARNATLIHHGNRHVVDVVNLSPSGAMIRFRGTLSAGDEVQLQLLDERVVTGQVRWVRDDRIGLGFASPASDPEGQS